MDAAPADRRSMYCHSCHHQWHRETDAIECPVCDSASTEIVTPENDPRHFHNNRQSETQQQAGTVPTPGDAASAQANTNNQGHANNQPYGPPPPPGHPFSSIRSPLVMIFPPPQITFFTTIVTHPPASPAPQQAQAGTQAGTQPEGIEANRTQGPGAQPQLNGPSIPHFAHFNFRFMMPRSNATPASSNTEADAPQGTGSQHGQPQSDQQHPRSEGPPPPEMMMALFQSFLGPFGGFGPFGGDAVYSQEQLDRIITQLREAQGPGGAPPASQSAIDKLAERELDEKMMGGETKTRCTICIDEMSLGEKASVLPCSHYFHGECVTTWLKQHNTCPVCRRPVEEEMKPAKTANVASHGQATQQAPDVTGCS